MNKLILVLLVTTQTHASAESIFHQEFFLPGDTTSGHHQFKEKCDLCHDSFNNVGSKSCERCHSDLASYDSHPAKKFRDPRNAELLVEINVMSCLTCHVEHKPKRTSKGGVTLPLDYCSKCHQQIGNFRKTHVGLPFDGCRECHNFHDNKGLYEDFLEKHIPEADIQVKKGNHKPNDKEPTAHGSIVYPGSEEISSNHPKIFSQWSSSPHAQSLSCKECHENDLDSKIPIVQQVKLCENCHQEQAQGFKKGRHGMRVDVNLEPMMVAMATIPVKASASHLSLSCQSCHDVHALDLQNAGTNSCLNCHSDNHSLAFKTSKHFTQAGLECSSCHMPKIKEGSTLLYTQHSQNWNLRPNSKMIRSVCLDCHGMQIILDSLADTELIQSNFSRLPGKQLPSIDWVRKRTQKNGIEKNKLLKGETAH